MRHSTKQKYFTEEEKLQARREAVRRYQKNHREKVLAQRAEYRSRTVEQRKQSMDSWRKQHTEHVKAYKVEYRKNNPEQHRAEVARRRHKARLGMNSLDITISVEYRKAISNDNCFYCTDTLENMQVDHFFPLAKGGTDHWFNLVLACARCNGTKSARCGTYFGLREGYI